MAVATGATEVTAVAPHAASRTFYKVMAIVSSRPDIAPPAPPRVIFATHSGVRIRKALEPKKPDGVSFSFTQSGVITDQISPEAHADQLGAVAPLAHYTQLAGGKGSRVASIRT